MLGEYVDSLDYPVCTKFQPTVLKGKLCYSLNVKEVLKQEKESVTESGKGKGILLIIDSGLASNQKKTVQGCCLVAIQHPQYGCPVIGQGAGEREE